MRRRLSTSLTTGFLTRSIYTLLSKVVFNFFNSVKLLEFPILDLHDCIYWSFSRCFRTTWKLLLTPGGPNQIFLKPFWVKQWYIHCSQLWFSMQTVSKAAFNSMLAVLWTRRSQYFTAIAHALFIIGNLPSSPRTAMLLAYLLTFNKVSTSLELLIKTPLLHILYYINGLTHDFWTRTGGWGFDRSHGAGTSSPSHWQQVEEQVPKPVGWTMCFLLMTLVPVQKLCVNIYVYVYIYVCTFLIRVLL